MPTLLLSPHLTLNTTHWPLHYSYFNVRWTNETIRLRVASRRQEASQFHLVVHLAPYIVDLDNRVEDVEVTVAGPRIFHFSFPPQLSEATVRYVTLCTDVPYRVLETSLIYGYKNWQRATCGTFWHGCPNIRK